MISDLLQGQTNRINYFLVIFILSLVKISKRRKEKKKMIEESKKISG